MANDGERNQNGSQFFMTVAPTCEWLDKKHTIFAKIQGETIYNLIKISELEVSAEGDRPICDPIPMIERAIVLEQYFDDIIPRQLFRPTIKPKAVVEKKASFKAIKNHNLMSFADEEEYGEEEIALPRRKGLRPQHEAEGNGKEAKKVISEEQLA